MEDSTATVDGEKTTDYARDKHEGNALFNAGDIDGAIECWSRPMRSLTFILSKGKDFESTPDHEGPVDDCEATSGEPTNEELPNERLIDKGQTNWEKFVSLYIALSLNLSLAYLKKGEYNKCIQYCKSVLEREKSNPKALFRIIQANIKLGNYKDAQEYCKQALTHHPNGQDFKLLKQRIDSYMIKDENTHQKVMRNMIKSLYSDPRSIQKRSIVHNLLTTLNKLWTLLHRTVLHYSQKLFAIKGKIF